MQPPVVTVVGEIEHREFAAPLAWLREQTRLSCFTTCAAAGDAIRSGEVLPSWIVVTAPHRAAFTAREIERLHRRAPLTRLVTLLGSWCEGETRSGQPLPGVSRVYWHEFIARAEAELLGPARNGYAGWWLPRTANTVDLAMTITRRGPRKTNCSLAIIAPTRERFESLADAAQGCGYAPLWQRDKHLVVPGTTPLLYDSDSLTDSVAAELKHLADIHAKRPILALLHFPRLQEALTARELGLAGIIAKPFLIGDLGAHLARLLPPKKRATAA